MALNVPLTYDEIVKMVEEHGIKLARLGIPSDFPFCCVVSTIAFDNGTDYYSLKIDVLRESRDTYNKLRSIEAGFEGDPLDFDDFQEELHLDPYYYEIGERLYKYSLIQSTKGEKQ